jgi:hypothetical protein
VAATRSATSAQRRMRAMVAAAGGTVAPMLHRRWFPDHIDGSLIVLRRHTRDNLRDFLRW